MRVIYKKLIREKIADAVAKAERQNRTIDFIELNREEMGDLHTELRLPHFLPHNTELKVYGVTILPQEEF